MPVSVLYEQECSSVEGVRLRFNQLVRVANAVLRDQLEEVGHVMSMLMSSLKDTGDYDESWFITRSWSKSEADALSKQFNLESPPRPSGTVVGFLYNEAGLTAVNDAKDAAMVEHGIMSAEMIRRSKHF